MRFAKAGFAHAGKAALQGHTSLESEATAAMWTPAGGAAIKCDPGTTSPARAPADPLAEICNRPLTLRGAGSPRVAAAAAGMRDAQRQTVVRPSAPSTRLDAAAIKRNGAISASGLVNLKRAGKKRDARGTVLAGSAGAQFCLLLTPCSGLHAKA